MDDLLKLAQDAGMTQEQGETASGGLMSFLKDSMGEGDFNKVQEQMPGVEGAVEKYSSGDSGGGGGAAGLFGSAMSSFGVGGSSSGGGSAAGGLPALLATLTSKGINPSMVQKFLPLVAPLIKSKCGIDVSKYLGGGESTGAASSGSSSGGASNLMGQAMGMFGK